MSLGQKGEERDKPLRQVHLKVLRNCQVNCAMHARATGAVGSCARRSPAATAAAPVGDYTKLCPLSTPLQTQLHNHADNRLKIKWHRAVPNLEKPAPKRTESRQRQSLTLTYLAVFDPFRCRINLQRDKPFLCQKSSPGWWLLLLFFVRNYKKARDTERWRFGQFNPITTLLRCSHSCHVLHRSGAKSKSSDVESISRPQSQSDFSHHSLARGRLFFV